MIKEWMQEYKPGNKEDIVRFIPDDSVLKIWSPQYFKDLVEKLKFK